MMLIRKGTGEDPRLIEKDKVPYLEFEALKKQSWLTHAFSTRPVSYTHLTLPTNSLV